VLSPKSFGDAGAVERLDPAVAPGQLAKNLIATAVAAAVVRRLDLLPIAALRSAADGEPDGARLRLALDAAEALARPVP
jgi:hypothetical protein